jgi:hypothetical protein
MNPRRSTAAPILAVLAIVLLPLAAYVGGYFVVVEGKLVGDSPNARIACPAYSVGGDYAALFFDPIYNVDRQWIRPGYWDGK